MLLLFVSTGIGPMGQFTDRCGLEVPFPATIITYYHYLKNGVQEEMFSKDFKVQMSNSTFNGYSKIN